MYYVLVFAMLQPTLTKADARDNMRFQQIPRTKTTGVTVLQEDQEIQSCFNSLIPIYC